MGQVVAFARPVKQPWLACFDLRVDRLDPRSARYCPAGASKIPRMGKLLCRARAAHWNIVHIIDEPGERRSGPIAGLAPLSTEPVFERRSGSPFSISVFRETLERTTTPTIFAAGFALEDAVISAVLVGRDAGIEVVPLEDAVASSLGTEADKLLIRTIASIAATATVDALERTSQHWRWGPA